MALDKAAGGLTVAGASTGRGSLVQRIINMVARKYRKNEDSLAIETMNPLWNLDIARAQSIFDCARQGNYAQLQYIYAEIEKTDPTLLVCVTRRASALSELGWHVVESDQRLHRGADESLVKEQIEAVETAVAKIENFPEAVEHLALAAFRGYSHVTPIHDGAGNVKTLECLDNWNFCFDRARREWLWNPSASYSALPKNGYNGLKAIPHSELVSVVEKRAIDWPALKIFMRTSIGERDWGRFLETYGLPPVIITMPELTSEVDEAKFVEAAQSVFEGRNGVVPYGSSISWASESRGTNPFTDFIEHQQKLIVLMATGGTLTSLAESGSGTLAGGAQMDVWQQIVRRDTRIISNVVNKQLCEPIVRKLFKDQPVLARFELDTEPRLSAKDVLELAQMANGAGLQMDVGEISQLTGYTITRAENGGMGGMGGGGDLPPDGGDDDPDGTPTDGDEGEGTDGDEPKTPQDASEGEGGAVEGADGADASTGRISEDGGKSVGNARVALNADAGSGAKGSNPAQRLAWSLQTDFRDVADRLNEILNMPEEERPEAARKLMEELDSLVPEDPAMAAVIAEQMAQAFTGVVDHGGDVEKAVKAEVRENGSSKTVKNAVQPEWNGDLPVVFNMFGDNPCPKCGSEMTKEGKCHNPKCESYSGDGGEDAHEVRRPLNERCKEALEKFKNSNETHPTAQAVADGTVDPRTALKLGFVATVAGSKITFYTEEILGDHYTKTDRDGRIDILPHVIKNLGKMMNQGTKNGKRVFYPDKPTTKDGRKHVLIVDDETGMAISTMMADDAYIRREFGSWKKRK